jgi:hypothetical protein
MMTVVLCAVAGVVVFAGICGAALLVVAAILRWTNLR